MKTKQYGFSLNQLLLAAAIIGLLAAVAYPSYQNYTRSAKLRAVQAALLENAQFMERFYQQHHSFKINSTKWPDLPIKEASGFCILPHGVARGALDDKFTLKAVALDSKQEPRILKINESLTTVICESTTSACNTGKNYFRGSDKNCTVFQP